MIGGVANTATEKSNRGCAISTFRVRLRDAAQGGNSPLHIFRSVVQVKGEPHAAGPPVGRDPAAMHLCARP